MSLTPPSFLETVKIGKINSPGVCLHALNTFFDTKILISLSSSSVWPLEMVLGGCDVWAGGSPIKSINSPETVCKIVLSEVSCFQKCKHWDTWPPWTLLTLLSR
jgi:hypothetical protein